ncbi:regulation of nuclear pre-mRNA domain-containing protein 1B [Chrysoperla carnea]|uniref:regulation of nuclear pre-mRNA domain-containing protein 1B n=1 Tax=Chrysoperla carnea TaxID=189513 RepID=UPI001D086184|nr:regulation of nuclear pre-mRNA domain-containing protein 1B [Chrysoperla carnea]
MSNFSEGALIKKLAELNPSQQSIQTLSLWLIHHRKHHAAIVKVWFKELLKAKDSRKLTFMYLANDVIQNSKKKGPEFGREFGSVLRKAFEHMGQTGYNEKIKASLGRVLQIWGERGVYDPKQIKEFTQAFATPANSTAAAGGDAAPPPTKKSKTEHVDKNSNKAERKSKSPAKERKRSDSAEVTVKIDGTLETHVKLSPHTPAGDPPEPEELVRALQELENAASSDAAVRERIASLPPEVSEIGMLASLQDRESAERLSAQVSEAIGLLLDYNSRLAAELDGRKKVAAMLRDFTQAQQELLAQAEQRLEEYTEKLQKVHAIKQEVKSHIQNLPDLTQLPDVTGGLAPLPSAGDLFSI